MGAKRLIRRSEHRDDGTSIHLLIWQLEAPLAPCTHPFKYRLAYVVEGVCVVRYDNERGKGDHRHLGKHEEACAFSTPRQPLADFMADTRGWQQ